jgi:hypothetical protein
MGRIVMKLQRSLLLIAFLFTQQALCSSDDAVNYDGRYSSKLALTRMNSWVEEMKQFKYALSADQRVDFNGYIHELDDLNKQWNSEDKENIALCLAVLNLEERFIPFYYEHYRNAIEANKRALVEYQRRMRLHLEQLIPQLVY